MPRPEFALLRSQGLANQAYTRHDDCQDLAYCDQVPLSVAGPTVAARLGEAQIRETAERALRALASETSALKVDA